MNNNINVKIMFKRILVYTPGTYKLSFHIKCQDKLLDFNCQPDFNFEQFQNGWFQMHPWQQLELVNDGIALVDNNVTVDIDKGLHSSAVFLHVHLLRYDENKATSSQNEGFSVFATGKLLLERSASLFSSGTEEDQEIHHTLQLFSTFIDEQTQIARGWIKYSMFVTTMKHKSTPCTPTNLIESCSEIQSVGLSSEQIVQDISSPVFAPFNYKAFVSDQFVECDSQSLEKDEEIKTFASNDDTCHSDSISSGAGHNLKVILEPVTEEDERVMSQDSENRSSNSRKFNNSFLPMNAKANQLIKIQNMEELSLTGYSTSGLPVKEHEAFKRSTKIMRTPPNKQSVLNATPEKEMVTPTNAVAKTPLFFKRKLHIKKKSLSPKAEVKSIDTNVPEIKEDVEKTDQMEQIPDEQEDEKVFDEHEKNIYIRRKTMESSLPDMKFEIDLPDKNAIQLMLPKFHALTTQKYFEPNVRPHVPIVEPGGESVEEVAKDDVVPTALSPRFKENLDGHVIAVLDYQAKELERYRNVVQRMGEDVVSLRRQITVLKHEKSQLTTKLYYSDGDVTNDGHLGVLKQSLAAEHQEKIALQERVYKLQDDIIKKNEMEASYLELQAAHEITKKNIQTLQDRLSKVKLLETTCQKQEKVIEALEKQTEFKKKSETSEDRLKKKKQTKFPAQLIDKDDVNFYDIHEKLRLIERIEQAESTIRALEEQLQVNANQWARDRALLQQRDDNMLLMRAHNFDPTPALKYVQPRARDLTHPTYNDDLNRLRRFPNYSYHRRRDENFRW